MIKLLAFYKKTALTLLLVLLMSFIFWAGSGQKDIISDKGQNFDAAAIFIGQKRFNALVANTPYSQEKGLGGRMSLPRESVMIFTFSVAARYGIWMKDMAFPIDILWLKDYPADAVKDIPASSGEESGLVVVDLKENVSPLSFPEVFTPKSSANYVLEADTGFVGENNLKIGSKIYFSKNG